MPKTNFMLNSMISIFFISVNNSTQTTIPYKKLPIMIDTFYAKIGQKKSGILVIFFFFLWYFFVFFTANFKKKIKTKKYHKKKKISRHIDFVFLVQNDTSPEPKKTRKTAQMRFRNFRFWKNMVQKSNLGRCSRVNLTLFFVICETKDNLVR